MIWRVFSIACVFFALAQTGDVEDIIGKTVTRYEKMNSFYAEFEQILCDEVTGTCTRYEGILHFLKPNYFTIEMKEPERIYVSNSESLWIYIPEEKRAIRQPLEQVPFEINPDLFLEDYDERFTAELSGDSAGYYEITLTPIDEADFYDKIVVSIAKKKYEITALSIYDDAGSENKYIFNKTTLNKKINISFFEFKPPEGTRIDEF